MTTLQNLLYWKLVIFKTGGKAMMAGILSIAATLNGSDWSQFTATQKFLAIAAALGSMWAIVDAFLDTTIADAKDAQPEAVAAQEAVDAKNALANPAPDAIKTP